MDVCGDSPRAGGRHSRQPDGGEKGCGPLNDGVWTSSVLPRTLRQMLQFSYSVPFTSSGQPCRVGPRRKVAGFDSPAGGSVRRQRPPSGASQLRAWRPARRQLTASAVGAGIIPATCLQRLPLCRPRGADVVPVVPAESQGPHAPQASHSGREWRRFFLPNDLFVVMGPPPRGGDE